MSSLYYPAHHVLSSHAERDRRCDWTRPEPFNGRQEVPAVYRRSDPRSAALRGSRAAQPSSLHHTSHYIQRLQHSKGNDRQITFNTVTVTFTPKTHHKEEEFVKVPKLSYSRPDVVFLQ